MRQKRPRFTSFAQAAPTWLHAVSALVSSAPSTRPTARCISGSPWPGASGLSSSLRANAASFICPSRSCRVVMRSKYAFVRFFGKAADWKSAA